MQDAIDQKIGQLADALEPKRGWFPRSVGEIPDFPYSNFDDLSQAFRTNEFHLHRHAYELVTGVFDILATPFERFMSSAYSMSFVVIPIASIALGYFVSWWFLLALLLIPISMRQGKKLYNRVIFRGAFESEAVFCFLYRIGQINVVSADFHGPSYYWSDKPAK
jgi:hypothetical protein